MELKTFQEEVSELTRSWQEPKIEWLMMLLTEELGELVHAIRREGRKRWGHEDEEVGSIEHIAEELGDILFLVARISVNTGADLDAAASAVLKKMKMRVAPSS